WNLAWPQVVRPHRRDNLPQDCARAVDCLGRYTVVLRPLTGQPTSGLFRSRGQRSPPARRHAQESRPGFRKGRSMSSYTSISSDKLYRLIGTASAPALIDVRIDEDFAADPRLIPGAVRRSHLDVQDWASQMTGKSIVVVCNKGEKLSEGTAAWL